MVYRNTTSGDPAAIYQPEEGAASLAREAGRRPPKARQGLLTITLIALLTRPRSLIVEAANVQTGPELLKQRNR